MNAKGRTVWMAGIVALAGILVGITLAKGQWWALLAASVLLVEALVFHLLPFENDERCAHGARWQDCSSECGKGGADVPCAHNERWQDCAGECWREKAEGWAP